MFADEDLHRHAVENLDQADALLFGRVTYEMMEAAFRPPARTGARPDWMEPFARTIAAAKGKAVQQLKRESGTPRPSGARRRMRPPPPHQSSGAARSASSRFAE